MIKFYKMKHVLFAATAFGGLALLASPGFAGPLAPAQIGATSTVSKSTSGLLEDVYYYRRHRMHHRYAYRRHHHHRFYANRYYYYPNYYAYDDCDGYYGGYYGDCGYPYPAYGFGFPFFAFGFGGHHHHHW